jgi:hypothetical protein
VSKVVIRLLRYVQVGLSVPDVNLRCGNEVAEVRLKLLRYDIDSCDVTFLCHRCLMYIRDVPEVYSSRLKCPSRSPDG